MSNVILFVEVLHIGGPIDPVWPGSLRTNTSDCWWWIPASMGELWMCRNQRSLAVNDQPLMPHWSSQKKDYQSWKINMYNWPGMENTAFLWSEFQEILEKHTLISYDRANYDFSLQVLWVILYSLFPTYVCFMVIINSYNTYPRNMRDDISVKDVLIFSILQAGHTWHLSLGMVG